MKGHKRAARFGTSPIEGQISRIKAIKRQMYGRANYALLRRRVLLAALQPIQSRSLMLCRAIVLRARRIAGFVLDALEQALHDRRPIHRGGLVDHSDRVFEIDISLSN